MDQKEKEQTQAADPTATKEDVKETENTLEKPEKTTDNVPSSADKIMEQSPSEKPQDQPPSVETQDEASSAETKDDIHSTENPSPEKPSSVFTPEKAEDQKPETQTARDSQNSDNDKSEKDLHPIEHEKQTEKDSEPIAKGVGETKPPEEKSEEAKPASETASQPSNTTDDCSENKLHPAEGESYTKQTEEDPKPITKGAEEQMPTDEPTKDLQPAINEVDPEPITKGTEKQKPSDGISEEEKHTVNEQDANANVQVSSSKNETAEELKPGVQDVPTSDISTTGAIDQDTALGSGINPSDKTDDQNPTGNESVETEVKDIADRDLQTEANRQQTDVSQDTLQNTTGADDTTAKQPNVTDEQPTVIESIPNKKEDDTVNVEKDEISSQGKDDVQEDRPHESKTKTEDNPPKSHEEVSVKPEKQESGKESLNAPVEEVTKASVEEIGTTDKLDKEGPRHRFSKTTEEERKEQKEPEEEIKEEGDSRARGDSSNVQNQERQFKDELIDTLGQLQESMNSPIVCALVVFAMVVFVVLLRCLFSLNAICYTLLYYSVLIIFGYPLTLCMVRHNLDRSVIRLVVGIFCVLFSVLFYKCRPTITWMTEISEYL